jgi:hypothetical protein
VTDDTQYLLHRILQLHGAFGGLHAAVRTNEKLIIENGSQSAERRANCRLAQFESLGHTRDGTLMQERIENDQKIQIQSVQLHEAFLRRLGVDPAIRPDRTNSDNTDY